MFKLASIKTYTVHVKPDAPSPLETAALVKEGFHLWAFIFGIVWALYHRLWGMALLYLLCNIALGVMGERLGMSDAGLAIVQLGFQAIMAYLADDFLRAGLKKQGYIIADIVTAESDLRAELRFFERYAAAPNFARA